MEIEEHPQRTLPQAGVPTNGHSPAHASSPPVSSPKLAAPASPQVTPPSASPSVVASAPAAGLAPAVIEPAPKRGKARFVLIGLLLAAAVGGTLVYRMGLGKESTDDAQIEGRVISIAARVNGQVQSVHVSDNQVVKKGTLLVELDPRELSARAMAARADLASTKAQLSSAQANLDLTERNITANIKQARGTLRQATSGKTSATAAVQQASADLRAARSRFDLAKIDLERTQKLVSSGAASTAELDARQAAFDQAQANLAQSDARVANAAANTTSSVGAISVAQGRLVAAETGPQQVQAAKAAVDLAASRVEQAEAALQLAELNLSYTKIYAPSDGVVSRRTVEVGQLVSPERALLALVPPDDIWVVANFKEDQLREMRAGQKAQLTVDTYGRRRFPAHIDSIAGATGARFSLLPPDNASGNFVKVSQRIPVLIRLDSPPPPELPLRPGMSAYVTVLTAGEAP